MSSPIAHSAVGYAIYSAFRKRLPKEPVFRVPSQIAWPVIAMFLCLLPDMDVIPAWITGSFERFHNNLSHSLLVCTLIPFLLAPILLLLTRISARMSFLLILTCCYSHILIDLCTMGRGVMLFWPWSATRFHGPVTLFLGVPWSSSLASPMYLLMLLNDTCFAVAVIAAIIAIRKRKEQ